MKLQDKYKSLFEKYELNTPLRIAHFMAQIEHESGLKPISENLNYSAKRMLEIFKSDFDVNRDKWLSPKEKEKVLYLLGSPQRIANFVYANQNGNGNEASGEGWKYRGRGFIQITGKENYFRLANDTDLDCFKNPDLLLEEANAMISALWYWNLKELNKLADKNDIVSITKKINGGLNGIEHRKELLKKYLK
jgi:putative chitinase